MENYTTFTPKQIDGAYVNALVDLVNACRANNVEIDKVCHYQNGWHITFAGHPHADAICHDGSYGSPCYMADYLGKGHDNDWSCRFSKWETIGFPWDYDDVSTHDPEELALYLRGLNEGNTPWEDEDC